MKGTNKNKRTWLIEIRKEKGLKQSEVAVHVGVTRQMISAIENGVETHTKTAKKIAKLYGINWQRFYEEEEKPAV